MTTEQPAGGVRRLETDLQKVDIRCAVRLPSGFDSDALLAVFGRWRLEEGEEIIDLADYGHVPDGPGCLLVSQRWHFGIHWSGGEPGVFLSSRRGLEGNLEERLRAAVRTCLEKGRRLLAEKELEGAEPVPGALAIVLNDRLLAPNTDDSDARVRPALAALLDRLYGKGAYTVERETDPRSRLGYRVRCDREGLTFESSLAALA